jgi:hypothetical protein
VEKGPTREGTIGGRGALLSLVLLLLALVLPVRIALTALGRLVRDKAGGRTCDAGRGGGAGPPPFPPILFEFVVHLLLLGMAAERI